MAGQFNTNNLLAVYAARGRESITVRAWNGNLTITYFGDSSNGRPVASVPLTSMLREWFKETFERIMKDGPGTSENYHKHLWDGQTKSKKPGVDLIFGMNDNKVVYLTIKSPDMPEPFVGVFKAAMTEDFGKHYDDDSKVSILAAKAFISSLYNDLPASASLSRDAESMKQAFSKQRNNYSGGGGNTGGQKPKDDVPWG